MASHSPVSFSHDMLNSSTESANSNSWKWDNCTEHKSKFTDWKRKVRKSVTQRMGGKATVANDENTGDIDIPLKNFELQKSRLNDVQNDIENYIHSMESTFLASQACIGAAFFHNNGPRDDDMTSQVKNVTCNCSVQEMIIRGLNQFHLEPLKVVIEFCNVTDEMLKRRTSLLHDYDHHKRKLGKATSHRKLNRKVKHVMRCLD